MGMIAGTAGVDGMADAIYDAIVAEYGAATGALETDRVKFCNLIASAVVGYIKTNADVVIGTGDGGLQKTTTAGAATDPPDSPVTIAGAVD